MIGTYVILAGIGKLALDTYNLEKLKGKMFELSEEEKKDILMDKNRRFVHFTSKESAEAILKSGFFIPTKGVIKNHFSKEIDANGKSRNSEMVYMFDTKNLNVNDYIRNLPLKDSPFFGKYEYYAVSTSPDEYEINNFKRRVQDDAITYNGRLDISGTDTHIAKYILELDEKGDYTLNEYPLDYEYKPSKELLNKLEKEKLKFLKYIVCSIPYELKVTKQSKKRFRANKEEYIRQIQSKRDFAKANKQFLEEQNEKSYIYTENGKSIVVKNLGYEIIDGKKLQKIALIGNGFDDENKNLSEVIKTCYMDTFNLDNIDPQIANKYFFKNYYEMLLNKENETKYIGLPSLNLGTKEVINEYDDKFNIHYQNKVEAKKIADKNYSEYINNKKLFTKIKIFFNKIFGIKNNIKMLTEAVDYNKQEIENLKNTSNKNLEDVDVTGLEVQIKDLVNTPYEIYESETKRQNLEKQTLDRQNIITENNIERDHN